MWKTINGLTSQGIELLTFLFKENVVYGHNLRHSGIYGIDCLYFFGYKTGFSLPKQSQRIDPSCKTEDSSCKMELMMSEEVGYMYEQTNF